MIGRNDPCWCGSGVKWKKCHFPKEGGPDALVLDPKKLKELYLKHYQIIIKTPEQINGIRRACQLSSQILDAVCARAVAGATTKELDDYCKKLHQEAGAIPAALNYGSPPFPGGACYSLNEVICHGFPNEIPLIEGDIINVDVASILNGYFGDCSRMVVIGKTTPERQLVVDVAYECLMRAIAILRPGVKVCDIGEVIESYATSQGCSVVYQFVAHGVGVNFHEGPQVPHCRNENTVMLVPGMTFTIEPMINAGVPDAVIDRSNGWIARTRDGRASAQWEHTVLITDSGHEVLSTWTR